MNSYNHCSLCSPSSLVKWRFSLEPALNHVPEMEARKNYFSGDTNVCVNSVTTHSAITLVSLACPPSSCHTLHLVPFLKSHKRWWSPQIMSTYMIDRTKYGSVSGHRSNMLFLLLSFQGRKFGPQNNSMFENGFREFKFSKYTQSESIKLRSYASCFSNFFWNVNTKTYVHAEFLEILFYSFFPFFHTPRPIALPLLVLLPEMIVLLLLCLAVLWILKPINLFPDMFSGVSYSSCERLHWSCLHPLLHRVGWTVSLSHVSL